MFGEARGAVPSLLDLFLDLEELEPEVPLPLASEVLFLSRTCGGSDSEVEVVVGHLASGSLRLSSDV